MSAPEISIPVEVVDAAINGWFSTLPDSRDQQEHFRIRMRAALAAAGFSAAGDAHELTRKTDLIAELSKIIHNITVAQQAAWIEWQHGAGAEAGMRWIENGLAGPGHIPEEDEPYGTEAQAYFDANQADPLPACQCGLPSNILHMGNRYCSQENYTAAIAAQQGKGGGA